jgi:ribosomal protein L1
MDAQGRGKFETEQLKENIKAQLNRLLTQLEDLEELKQGKLMN